MADERNVAHDKRVMEEKEAHGQPTAPEGATRAPQPGKKTPVDDAHKSEGGSHIKDE